MDSIKTNYEYTNSDYQLINKKVKRLEHFIS